MRMRRRVQGEGRWQVSAGRDDKARTRDRKTRVRRAIQRWRVHRAEVKKRKRVRRERALAKRDGK